MARDYYDESKPKKKKKETPKPQKVTKSPSVTKAINRTSNSTFLGGGADVRKAEKRTSAPTRVAKPSERVQRTPTRSTTPQRTTDTGTRNQTSRTSRLTAAQNQKMYGTTRPNLKTAEEMRKEREAQRKEREERRLAAQRQKSGLNDQPTAAQKAATDRALKNTLPIAKESAKGAAYGHLTTLNDVASVKYQGKGKSRDEIYDPNLVEKSRQQAEERVKKYQAKTQETEDAIQKLTKNAKGLEKAYYGAVESGTGMLTDIGVGALTGTGQVGSLAAMFSRTYGSTRGKAQQEGATQAEDRAYAAAQAAKEVGTELMFPGAGLARGYAGKQGLKLADTAANILTKNLRGKAADIGGAGVRLLGGVLEENAEEFAGWGLDPLIKEITYGKKARTRNAQQAMKERSNALRAEIQNEDDARAAAAYLSSDDFFEQTVNAYREAGLSKKDAEEVADRMRDYLTASLTGDTDSMEQIEDEVSKKVAGSKKLEWDFDELKDTIASTTLLTAATGLLGTGMTAVKGAALRDQLGDDGVRALASTAIDFEDSEMSLKAKAMKARLDSGNELTSTQVYDLQVGMQEQIRKDTQREESSRRMADKRIKSDNLLTPYRQNENGGIDLDEATEASYREHVSRAKDIIDGLTSETKESLTANEKVDGSKAIAGFQTGVFTVDDANALNYSNTAIRSAFEAATGVDLGQYVVKNKDGSVNIPATNTKTKDALFAMAADNLVKSAQAETENWMDNTKGQVVTQVSARMGAQGSAVLQQALDDVDERDRSKYMMTANATDMLYQAARNMGTEWESIAPEAIRMFPGISESKLKMMYEAGLADREMANDKARGRQVRMGQALTEMGEQETATGKVFIDTEVPLKGSVIRTFTEIAKNLGADIHFVDYIYDSENNPIAGANGSYDPNTNTFYLNVATGAETNIGYIFMHETTHYLKTYAPEQYQALENLVRERWFAFNPSQMQDAIARKIEAYKRATKGQQVLTEEQALEEIIADASHDFINDPEFAKQVAEEDMGLAKALLDSIRNALRMLRRIFASDSIDDDTHMNSLFRELDIMAEAEKLWLDAYKVAVQNSAVNAVNEWQDNVNAQSSLSVSDGYTIQDGNARWTDDRIDRLITKYGASNPDYSKAYAAYINPRDFLRLTIEDSSLRKWRESLENQPEEIKNLPYKEAKKAVWDRMDETGEWLDDENFPLDENELRSQEQTPFLIIRSKSGNMIQGHEGRHRMRALMEAGVTSVPVAIEDIDTKYEKQSIAEMRLGSQEFVNVGNGIVTVTDLVPIKESNRDELIQKFGGEAQVRYSISDEDYMKAVESDDMETAQRMVDAAAAMSMPNTKLKGRWFHGTENEFTEFNFSQGGKNGTADGFGIYLTNDPEVAASYGERMIEGYVNVERPASALETTTLTKAELRKLIKKTVDNEAEQIAEDYGGDVNEAKFDTWISNYTDTRYAGNIDNAINEVVNSITLYNGNDMDIIQEIMVGMGIRNYDEATKFYDILTETTGIDGFETKWGDESEMADPSTPTIALAFRSEQIKSADPVTYGDDGKVIPLSERFNLGNKDIRYSIAEQYDEPYMGAVNSDKLDEAQKYVDEAAKLAGMRVVHRYHGTLNAGFTVFSKAKANVEGNSGAGFYFSTNEADSAHHYSEEEGADNKAKIDSFADYLMEFEGEWNGVAIDSDETAHRIAAEEMAKNPGVFDVYLNYKRPYVRNYRKGDYLNDITERDYSTNIYDDILDDFDESLIDPDDYENEDDYEEARYEAMDEHLYEAIDDAVRKAYTSIEENYEVIDMPFLGDLVSAITTKAAEGSLTWGDISSAIFTSGEVFLQNENTYEDKWGEAELTRAIIEGFGYDAIEDKEVDKKFGQLSRDMMEGTEHIIVFRPEQIKLADTITYAEDGSIIPLSERFDPNNDDIRYSLPTQDSDGNILTDGQMEYFQNSQARDSQGRLVPVYHTTNMGGFTVFDPSYSEDQRSIFFTDSEAVSKTYGAKDSSTTYECYLNFENPLIVDADYNAWDRIPMTRRIGSITMTEDYDTIEVAAFAYAEGYDSVIIRNCRDWAVDDSSDFDSEENSPYSGIYIAFSSEQVKDVNNENPTENPDIRYSITPEDEAMEWLASQYELDDVPLEDPKAEEGRVRMAKSKQDFIKSRNALWNERWLTEGKVLDAKSVRKNIKELVTGAMMNSDTSRKYKTELVDKTLVDAKSAFWLMKEGKHSEAADLLWDSAVKMIENVDFIDDENFKNYKDLRDYMRTTSFRLGEEYWSDVDFSAFRKRNFGKIKLVKGETNIDEIYQELQERWPEWFDEDEQMTAPDQLLHIEEVLDAIQPYKIAYSSEEAEQLAGDIASDLYDIVYEGEEYKSIADTYKERYDAKTKALKERHQEALRKVREEGDLKVRKEKAKFKEYKEQKKNAKEKAKHFGRIAANIDWLTDRLLNETKDKNIPEGFRKSLAHMLMQFDMQTERSKKLEEKYGAAKKTLQMRELQKRLEQIAKEDDTGEFRYDGYLFYLMDALADKVDGKPIDSLDTEDLIVIDTMLRSIKHNFSNYNKVRLEEEKVAIANIGDSTIAAMEERIQKYGKRKNRTGTIGLFDKLVNEGEQTPIYLFERLDPTGQGIGAMYKELRRGEDQHIRNMNFLRNRFQSMFQEYFNKSKPGSELESWRDDSQAQTFNLENGAITLNPAQIMSLYCLSKRTQAMGHILGSGIVASPINVGQKLHDQFKGKDEQVNSVRITYSEIQDIITKLTPEQMKLADEMQSLLNNEMAAWGNETSLEMHGIKLFREKDYFPIKSSGESLAKTADSFDVQEKIKNFGFTKPLVRNANNAIMIDDIFSVVADHCNKMSLYNSMAIPISDFMRVYNYKQRREDGTVKTSVQAMIGDAFTRKVNDYIMKFIGDVNGNTKTRSDAVNDLMNKALANYKKASIGANFRVALQQPTAIFRALMAIDAKYFVGIKPISPADVKEMFAHCPIALWKSWGHYDMDMGRDIEDIMMNNDWSRWDTVTMGAYGALDNWTWSLIWQAVKKEVKENNPNVKVGSDEFFRLCNERASEVFDKTQVVDSIFHRSDTMRSKHTLTKMATSFMAEPTLTFNVFRDSLIKANEMWKDGDKAGAAMMFNKMAFVLALNAAAVSASAAIWDAVRGKGGGDDDDDEGFAELWLANFKQNFLDNAPWAQWNNIYFVKDIISLKDGWGTSNMALEGFETIFKGMDQLKKKITEGSNKSWYDIFMNLFGGFGYVTGVPVKTIMRDVKAVFEKFGIDVFAADGTEEDESLMDTIANKMGYKPIQHKGDGEAKVKDSFFARLGIGKTEEEKEQEAFDKKAEEIAGKTADLTGEAKDKKVWSYVTTYMKSQNGDKPLADVIQEGDYKKVKEYRDMYVAAGGDTEYFDERIFATSKSAMKKTIVYDPTDAQIEAQENIKDYLLNHGMTDAELSEMAYKSYTAKDMKIAFIINDKDAMLETLEPLVRAGLSYEDLERIWENRNRIDVMKYKNSKGRYADRLKSTGKFIWPTNGSITSYFGYRNAPTRGASSNHPAIDIGAPMGAEVVASDGGVVISTGWNGGYGNSVGIKHDNGMVTYYNHLSAWNVEVGDTVAQGQQIANVGSTGVSTGPHLDFKVLDANGKPVDPLKYLASRS